MALQSFMTTGYGDASLQGTAKNHQLMVAQRNQLPPRFSIPMNPMSATVPYEQPQIYYGWYPSSQQTSNTKQHTNMKNVTVENE
jgi:hypothetical protein